MAGPDAVTEMLSTEELTPSQDSDVLDLVALDTLVKEDPFLASLDVSCFCTNFDLSSDRFSGRAQL